MIFYLTFKECKCISHFIIWGINIWRMSLNIQTYHLGFQWFFSSVPLIKMASSLGSDWDQESQLPAYKCYYETEAIVQLSKQAAWVSLLFSLVQPHLVLWRCSPHGWGLYMGNIGPSCWAPRVTALHFKFTYTVSIPKDLQNARTSVKFQNPGVNQIVGNFLLSCKSLEHLETFSFFFFFLFTTVPQSWALKSISEVLIMLNLKEKSLNHFLLGCSSAS